jgi:glycosyltransferase involved in cell wall biosynthesis
MKIAIDARIISISTGRYVERLLHHLQKIDHNNEYLVLLLAKDYETWQPSAPNFKKVKADFPIYSIAEQIHLLKLLRRLKPDLVHFTMPNHPVLYWGKHVTTIHDLTLIDYVNKRKEGPLKDIVKNVIKPAIFRGVMWWAATQSTAVITPSKHVREQLIRRFGARGGRVSVTYEAAEPLAAKPEAADLGQGDNFIMYCGNAFPYKNLWRLIRAYNLLHRPDLKLVLVGKKEYFYEQLEVRTKARGIEGVVFTGFIPDAQLAYLYKQAKLFVFPSLSEGFGLPPLEAMNYGVPVLAARSSCLPEVMGNGAHYFDPDSTESLVKELEGLLDDDERRTELAQAGSEKVKQYSWERMAELTLSIYERAR